MDPHWFGSLDPDPHWGKKLDPDPHWNQCGSTAPVGSNADQVKGMVSQECFVSASGQSPHFLAGFVSGVFPISDPDSSSLLIWKIAGLWIRITSMQILIQFFTSLRIRIWLLIILMRICDPAELLFERPWLHFQPPKLPNFDLNVVPDPAFFSNADPDPASNNSAVPDPQP